MEPLGGDEQVDSAVGGRNGQPGLRSEEGLVLHAHLVGALHRHQALTIGGQRVAVAQVDTTDDVSVRVDRRGRLRPGRVHERLGHLVLDLYGGECQTNGVGMVSGHDGHRFALVAHHIAGQHRLVEVLQAEGGHPGHVGMRQDGVHAGHGHRRSHVNRQDPGRRVGRPQGAAPEHPVVPEVAGEGEGTGHLGDRVGALDALPDPGGAGPPTSRRGLNLAHERASRRMAAARSTASRIRP